MKGLLSMGPTPSSFSGIIVCDVDVDSGLVSFFSNIPDVHSHSVVLKMA